MGFIKKIVNSSAILVLLDQAMFSGTNFILTLFLAQRLDIANFGLFSTIVIVGYLAMGITNALLIQPFQVSISKVSKKEEYYVSLFLGLMGLLLLFLILVSVAAFLLPFPKEYLLHTNAFICFVSGFLFQDFFRKLALGLEQLCKVLLIDIFFLVMVAVAFYVRKSTIDLSAVLWIIGLANGLSSFPGIWFLIKNYQCPVSWRHFVKDHFMQGKWLFSVALLQWCSSNFFVLVSGIYLGMEALGVLRLVQSFFGLLNVILQSVENYLLPKVARLYSESADLAKQYLLMVSVFGAFVFGTVLSVTFFLSDAIIILAGGKHYQDYGYVVKIIAILYFFIFLGYPIRIAVRVLVLNKIFFIGYAISFLFSILSFHFLLRYSGLYGAVGGLICNQIIMILYWQNQLTKNQFQLWK